MADLSNCPNVPSAVPSTYELLFKHNKQSSAMSPASPQDDTQVAPALDVKQPMMLADLHALRELTQQLHTAESGMPRGGDATKPVAPYDIQKSAESRLRHAEALATLYCRRAAALLAFVDFDATAVMPLEVLEAFSDDMLDEVNQPPASLGAVRQALQDAQAAVALTAISATNAEANFLAAQCARSLGELAHAREFIVLAAAANGSVEITRLAEQLELEATNSINDEVSGPSNTATKLITDPALLQTLVIDPRVEVIPQAPQQSDEDDEPNNDLPEQTEVVQAPLAPPPTLLTLEIAFWPQVAAHFQVLESAATSSWLNKLEHLMHHNVHHCCASPAEVKKMDQTLQTALALLLLLLQSNSTRATLGSLDLTGEAATRTLEKLSQAAATSPQTLVQNRTARKWLVESLAPEVRLALASSSALFETEGPNGTSRSPEVTITLLYDVLTMLARLLQASGSWRLCTNMAYIRAYAELSYNLSKQLRSEADAAVGNSSRLEIRSANVFGAALLQRHGELDQLEALKLHRESLQAALHAGDSEYELRSRFYVARTLRVTEETEAAYAELTQLLGRSHTLGDAHMEAVAQYELGVCCVARGELEKAQRHFKEAQTLCNQTADCSSTWRPRSVQQAIAFYARLKPTVRRGAIRFNLTTLVQTTGGDDNSEDSEGDDDNEEDVEEEEPLTLRPKTRRAAFCIKHGSPEHRSLLSALLGSTHSATELLASRDKPKPKRTLDWRHSVFATASQAEMKAKAGSATQEDDDIIVVPEEASI